MNPWDLPDHDELPENKFHMGGMDPEKDDKQNDDVTPEEMEKINKFLEELDRKNYPPNGPEDFIF